MVTESEKDKTTALNEGLIEGSAYKGRLLIGLELEILEEGVMVPMGACLETCEAIEKVR